MPSQFLNELIAANPGMSLAEIGDNLRSAADEIETILESEEASPVDSARN